MNGHAKKAKIRQFFAKKVENNALAFDGSLKKTISITPEMQQDLYQSFGIHPSFFETAHELETLLQKERIAQGF